MEKFGVLGNNARNLKYIKRFNPRKVIRLADNKIKTKTFLSQRGIPTPDTYGVIETRKQIYKFDFSTLPSKEFVVKPNKGSGGKGIYVVQRVSKSKDKSHNKAMKLFQRLPDKLQSFVKKLGLSQISNMVDHGHYFKLDGKVMDEITFKIYLLDMLDAKYSMTMGYDKILIEAVLKPGNQFEKYCQYGLADLRIIVFNLIPVASMLRVPTSKSGGKANLSMGGLGFGIEVGSGKIKSMLKNKKVYEDDFPGEYKDFYKKKIQFWNDVLLYSSKIQYFVNLGYLALDWVITNNGPKLLEINARAGLEVQNASLLRLQHRLEKVSDLKVNDPGKGVEIAQSLFRRSKSNIIDLSKVVYLSQKARIICEKTSKDIIFEDIIVKVDINKTKNYISSNLNSKISKLDNVDIVLDLYQTEVRYKNLVYEVDDDLKENTIILGKNAVEDNYIKPIQKTYKEFSVVNSEKVIEAEIEELHIIDDQLKSIGQQVVLSSILKPVNLIDEMDNYITWGGNYNPKFVYNRPSKDKLKSLQAKIEKIKDEKLSKDFGLKSEFADIFRRKAKEIDLKIKLLQAYQKNKYSDILKYNKMMYGDFDENLLQKSRKKLFMQDNDKEVLGKELTFYEVKKRIKQYLYKKKIMGVDVVYADSNVSRMSVKKGKNIKIKISNSSTFREKELESVLAHEIDVHLVRYLNGKKTGWNILKSGSGFYLKDEEGLAIYASLQRLPDEYEKKGMYKYYYYANQAQDVSFSRLAEMIRGYQGGSLRRVFKASYRLKRGIENTGFVDSGAIYFKDKVYLDGYEKIKKWIDDGGNKEKMMVGKITIQDLDSIY